MSEDENQGENRREFTRVRIHLDVGLYPDDRTTIIGVAHDLSLNGVYIPCTGRLPVGTDCDLRIYLEGRENESMQLEVLGKVSRSDESGMAVEFTGVPLDDLEHLRNLIRYNADDVEAVEGEFESHIGLKKKPDID